MPERVKYTDRVNDGETSYAVWMRYLRSWISVGRVVRIRPGVWMAEGHSREFATRAEAAQHLVNLA